MVQTIECCRGFCRVRFGASLLLALLPICVGCDEAADNEAQAVQHANFVNKTTEEIAAEVQTTDSPEVRQALINEIGERGREAWPQLREVVEVSQEDQVTAAAIAELGRRGDYKAMDQLIDGLDHDSPAVREEAFRAVHRMLGAGAYRPDQSKEDRQEAVEKIRARWQELFDGWTRRQPDQSRWPIFTGKPKSIYVDLDENGKPVVVDRK